MIIIKVESCAECPYLRKDRYDYCGKRFENCPEAYRAGAYVEWPSQYEFLMNHCPFKNQTEEK